MNDHDTPPAAYVWKAVGRSLLFPAAEMVWAGGFASAGRLLRPQARLSNPTGTDRVLVLAPHPDDETLGCGGTIFRHRRAGDALTVLIVTDGGSSRAGGLPREQMRLVRAREAESALA